MIKFSISVMGVKGKLKEDPRHAHSNCSFLFNELPIPILPTDITIKVKTFTYNKPKLARKQIPRVNSINGYIVPYMGSLEAIKS